MHEAPGLGGAALVGKGPPPNGGDGKTEEMSENGAGQDWLAKAELSELR